MSMTDHDRCPVCGAIRTLAAPLCALCWSRLTQNQRNELMAATGLARMRALAAAARYIRVAARLGLTRPGPATTGTGKDTVQ
jgi:hypothetical protein